MENKKVPDYFKEKCGDCCHFQENPVNEQLQRTGICRAMAPSPVAVMSQQGVNVQFVKLMIATSEPACLDFDDDVYNHVTEMPEIPE